MGLERGSLGPAEDAGGGGVLGACVHRNGVGSLGAEIKNAGLNADAADGADARATATTDCNV
jgi:hypothetical protein